MAQKWLIFAASDDVEKNLTENTRDYLEERPHYANDWTIPEEVDAIRSTFGHNNHTSPRFSISTENVEIGQMNDGFVLVDNLAVRSKNEPGWEKQRYREGYSVRHMREAAIIDNCDKHGFIIFAICGRLNHFKVQQDQLLSMFKYYYLKDGILYDCITDEQADDEQITYLYYCVKMGELPFYILTFNKDLLCLGVLSIGQIYPESGAIGVSRVQNNLKSSLFSPKIPDSVEKTGKYVLYCDGDSLTIEMFGCNGITWEITDIKRTHIPNFNDLLTVETNLPYTVTGHGEVNLDLSAMEKGEMAYVIMRVDCGEFFNKYVARQHRIYFEYAIVKK